MAFSLSSAMGWLRGTLQDSAGVSVSYVRGAYSVTLTGVLGQTQFRTSMDGASRLDWSEADVLLRADQLILNSAVVTPLRGDRLTISLNGTSVVFEPMTPENGEPCWRYSDPQREMIRLHLKRVS